ncbi:MAG: protein kinase, partial [Jatrophihabitantaceae bacterium]|nr:protein kinase [Jatrophihabitantaceae bacterium]
MRGPEAPLPVVAGRFRATGLLGVGGSATVYRALDDHMGGDVALKLFSPASEQGRPDMRRRREIQVLRSLEHPGVVSIVDGDPGGAGSPPFIATEYVDGPTLGAVLQGGPIPELDAARLGAELAEALAYVHSRGIVHRDVKPANILLAGASARGMLIDFGIALAPDETRLTTESMTSGTAGFLSPEQVRGEDIGPPTDVYALGLVLLECLTGQRCYPGGDVGAALARLFRQPAIPDLDSPLVADLLARMVALDPAERPTAESAASMLRGIGDGSLTDELMVLQSWSPVRGGRRGRLLIPVAAAAAIAASTAGIMLNLSSSRTA